MTCQCKNSFFSAEIFPCPYISLWRVSVMETMQCLGKLFVWEGNVLSTFRAQDVEQCVLSCPAYSRQKDMWNFKEKADVAQMTSSSSRWHYSPGWAFASSTICLQASRFLALALHLFTPIFLRSMDTSSSHLILGLPLRLVAYSFPCNVFFVIAVSCVLSM